MKKLISILVVDDNDEIRQYLSEQDNAAHYYRLTHRSQRGFWIFKNI